MWECFKYFSGHIHLPVAAPWKKWKYLKKSLNTKCIVCGSAWSDTRTIKFNLQQDIVAAWIIMETT